MCLYFSHVGWFVVFGLEILLSENLKISQHTVRYLETLAVVFPDIITFPTNYCNLYLTTKVPVYANSRLYLNTSLMIRPNNRAIVKSDRIKPFIQTLLF